jgi:small subunit ribosomal protein S7
MRRKLNIKRELKPDINFSSLKLSKFTNYIMESGKKNVARKIVADCMTSIKEKAKVENPLEVFEKALKNVSPSFEVKSRRVGGANYQIPFPVHGHRQLHFAFSWLVQAARARSGMPYSQRLALEIVDAYNETGAAFKKKEDTHKMAEANRAFAHFARG